MSRRTIEYGEFATFTQDGTEYTVSMDTWTMDEIQEEFAPIDLVMQDGWAIIEDDGCGRDSGVFQSRTEAALDLFGEDDPRVWR